MTEWVHVDDLRAEQEAADRRFLAMMRRKYQGRMDGDSKEIMRLIEICEGALWAFKSYRWSWIFWGSHNI